MQNPKKYPIFILCYQRPKHLTKVLDSLFQDPVSQGFPIYIFVDGLKDRASEKEIQNHQEILDLIQQIASFRKIKYFVASHNQGVFQSLLWGAQTILQDYEAFIYLEEDIVPKIGFLSYMQEALDYYQKHPDVYAINGYAFQEVEQYIKGECYTAFRFCPWGFATYKKQWEEVDWSLNRIRWKKWNPLFWIRFNRDSWGWGWTFFFYTFFPFLRKKIQPWDILYFLHHYLNHRVSIWKKTSLVNNTGLDGSGLHQGVYLIQNLTDDGGEKRSNESCFLEDLRVNLTQNKKISQRLSPIFRAKSFKTGLDIFRKKSGNEI